MLDLGAPWGTPSGTNNSEMDMKALIHETAGVWFVSFQAVHKNTATFLSAV